VNRSAPKDITRVLEDVRDALRSKSRLKRQCAVKEVEETLARLAPLVEPVKKEKKAPSGADADLPALPREAPPPQYDDLLGRRLAGDFRTEV
jgi:hypothetical protein